MPNIGIDLQGGDQAPAVVWEGLALALPELSATTKVWALGEDWVLKNSGFIARDTRVQLHSCGSAIAMGEHPIKALQQKRDSSTVQGFALLASGQIDCWASAGHSGAMMVGALQLLGTAPGVSRPVVVSQFPRLNAPPSLLLDVGINVDCKAEQFLEFAKIGSEHYRLLHQKAKPKLALLNTGEEPTKGSLLYQRAHAMLRENQSDDYEFIGNLEPNFIFDSLADILLCDGFTGNILLKHTESFYTLSQKLGLKHPFLSSLNYEKYGATPILGVNGSVLLGHGSSGPEAIKNMIIAAESTANANFVSTKHR